MDLPEDLLAEPIELVNAPIVVPVNPSLIPRDTHLPITHQCNGEFRVVTTSLDDGGAVDIWVFVGEVLLPGLEKD